jgi:lactoylglutathione lyase
VAGAGLAHPATPSYQQVVLAVVKQLAWSDTQIESGENPVSHSDFHSTILPLPGVDVCKPDLRLPRARGNADGRESRQNSQGGHRVKKTLLTLFALGLLGCAGPAPEPEATAPPGRPAITAIANFVIKTDSIDDARAFYGKYLGYAEAFTHARPGVAGDIAVFKINDRQFIEVSPTLANEEDDKMIQIGFETADAQQLRNYLAAKGVAVPATVETDPDGNLSFHVADPEGHTVEFVQYLPDSTQMKDQGQHLADTRISGNVLHVGVHIKDEQLANLFYKDILGFRPLWRGGMTDERIEWVSLLVPDGDEWVEYMMWEEANPPDHMRLGVWHHICVDAADEAGIKGIYDTVVKRGYQGKREPGIGRDGRWLLHLYDKHNTRTEVMARKPVEKPCCDPMTDPYTD